MERPKNTKSLLQYHLKKTFDVGEVLVCEFIMLVSHTDLHILHECSVNGIRYCTDVLLSDVPLFRGVWAINTSSWTTTLHSIVQWLSQSCWRGRIFCAWIGLQNPLIQIQSNTYGTLWKTLGITLPATSIDFRAASGDTSGIGRDLSVAHWQPLSMDRRLQILQRSQTAPYHLLNIGDFSCQKPVTWTVMPFVQLWSKLTF